MAPTIQVLNSDFELTIQALFMNSVLFKGLLDPSGGAAAAHLACRQLQCLEVAHSGKDSAAVGAVAVARNTTGPVTNSAGPASWPAGNA